MPTLNELTRFYPDIQRSDSFGSLGIYSEKNPYIYCSDTSSFVMLATGIANDTRNYYVYTWDIILLVMVYKCTITITNNTNFNGTFVINGGFAGNGYMRMAISKDGSTFVCTEKTSSGGAIFIFKNNGVDNYLYNSTITLASPIAAQSIGGIAINDDGTEILVSADAAGTTKGYYYTFSGVWTLQQTIPTFGRGIRSASADFTNVFTFTRGGGTPVSYNYKLVAGVWTLKQTITPSTNSYFSPSTDALNASDVTLEVGKRYLEYDSGSDSYVSTALIGSGAGSYLFANGGMLAEAGGLYSRAGGIMTKIVDLVPTTGTLNGFNAVFIEEYNLLLVGGQDGTGKTVYVFDVEQYLVGPPVISFTDVVNQALLTQIVSNQIVIGGVAVSFPVTIVGGEYSVNAGPFTSAAGSIAPGDTLTLRTLSSSMYSTQVDVIINVGSSSDTWSVTTAADMTPVIDPNETYKIAWDTDFSRRQLIKTVFHHYNDTDVVTILTALAQFGYNKTKDRSQFKGASLILTHLVDADLATGPNQPGKIITTEVLTQTMNGSQTTLQNQGAGVPLVDNPSGNNYTVSSFVDGVNSVVVKNPDGSISINITPTAPSGVSGSQFVNIALVANIETILTHGLGNKFPTLTVYDSVTNLALEGLTRRAIDLDNIGITAGENITVTIQIVG